MSALRSGGGTVAKCRCIVHLDLDAFYAQVERRRLCLPWGSLIAVSYAARPFGVKRGMKSTEAKKLCPAIQCVPVELLDLSSKSNSKADGDHHHHLPQQQSTAKRDNKVSLKRYRDASFEVMAVLMQHVASESFERASIDEAYMDLTHQVDELQAEGGWTEAVEALRTDGANKTLGGGGFEQLLAAVLEKTSFSMSGGIATNKITAKIASARHKPCMQTVVSVDAGREMILDLKITSIPGLGGKYGHRLQRDVLGIDSSTVKPKSLPKSINCVKSLTSPGVQTQAQMKRPCSLTIHHKGSYTTAPRSRPKAKRGGKVDRKNGSGEVSRTGRMPSTPLTADRMLDTAVSLVNSVEKPFPCVRISVSATGFVDLKAAAARGVGLSVQRRS
eukprot:gene9987-18927_t